MQAADFDYHLPDAAIAQTAMEPRDASRLLVAATLEDRRFADLPEILRSGDLLVVNRTRVRHARLRGTRVTTGGAVEALLLRRLDDRHWEALLRPSRRLRAGSVLRFGSIDAVVHSDPVRGVATVVLSAAADVDDVLVEIGEIPLPPYFHGELAHDDRYQTMFAKEPGSAAAPTAALHFTPRLVERLLGTGIGIAEIDLHVGLDTFRPMDDGPLETHVMHTEWFTVPHATVGAVEGTRRNGGRVVAVGTTSVRALETAAASGELRAMTAESDLFITPGHRFRSVDAVITNFHAPRTTLLALIAALVGPDWRVMYEHALRSGYRFLSFGDAMFVEEGP